MVETKKNIVVFLSFYRYRPGFMQQVLDNVFSKELGRFCEVIFLLQGDRKYGRVVRWNNAQVQLTPLVTLGGLFGRLINAILALNKFVQLAQIIKREKSIIIVVRDQPFWAALLGLFKCFFRYRVFFQYSAPLGEMQLRYFHLHKTLWRYIPFFSGMLHQLMLGPALRKSDLVFPITESFGKTLAEHYGWCGRMVPLPMGVDSNWIERHTHPVMWLEECARTNFIVGYFGTLSFLRQPKFMLEVFDQFRKSEKNCKFLIMGEVSYPYEKFELERLCAEMKIEEDVIFTGGLEKNILQDHLVYCDVTLSAIPPDSYYVISSPTKLYESLGNGIPVIANIEIYEHKKVLFESQGGIVVPYEVDAFAEALIDLKKDNDKKLLMGRNGKDFILSHYTYKKIAERIVPFFIHDVDDQLVDELNECEK